MVPGGEHVVKNTKWTQQYRLWPIGDIHWGARGCATKLVDSTLKRIKDDPNALWLGMGDLWDLIGPQDKRWDPENVAKEHRDKYFEGLAQEMLDYAYDRFHPIREKCIGLLQGNHEYTYDVRMDRAMTKDLSKALGVPFLGYSCFKDLVFKNGKKSLRIRIMAHHGAGWAQTVGGKINRLQRFVRSMDADIIFMGHVHIAGDLPVVTIGANEDCSHVEASTRLGVISGTFLKTYEGDPKGGSSYGERKGYEPVPIGSPCVVIEPGTGRLLVEKPVGKLGGRNG